MHRLRVLLVGLALLGVLVGMSAFTAAPASAASVAPAAVTHIVADRDRGYFVGFREGREAGDRFCRIFREHRYLRHERRENRYRDGFVDGFNFAMRFDRACQFRRR